MSRWANVCLAASWSIIASPGIAVAECPPSGCNDNDSCTLDTCVQGSCRFKHKAKDCPSNGFCAVVAYDCAAEACIYATQSSYEWCDDGNGDTLKDRCTSGGCVGQTLASFLVGSEAQCEAIPDGMTCKTSQCCEWKEPDGPCKGQEMKRCADDGLPWTVGEVCEKDANHDYHAKQGVRRCDDGNPCTRDWFDGVACRNTPYATAFAEAGCPGCSLPCDDGNPCTVGDSCRGTEKKVCQGTPVVPPAIDPPCATVVCDGEGGATTVPLTGAACEDGNPCTFNDQCGAIGQCMPGGAVSCDDGNPCTDDFCLGGTGPGCQHLPTASVPCDDGDLCTPTSSCSNGKCIGGQPTSCDDGDVATLDSCDPGAGLCHHMPDSALGGGHPDPDVPIPIPIIVLLFTPAIGSGGENALEAPHSPDQPPNGALGACPPAIREYLLNGPRECPDGIGGPGKCGLIDRPDCIARRTPEVPNLVYRRGRGNLDDTGASTLTDGLMALNAREFFPIDNPDPVDRRWVGSLSTWIGLDAVHGVDGTRPVTLLDANVSRFQGVERPWRLALELMPHSTTAAPRDQRRVLRLTAQGTDGAPLVLNMGVTDWVNGEWHMVTATWDTSRVRLYVDGRLAIDVARPATFPSWETMPDYLFLHGSARSHGGTFDVSSEGQIRLDRLETFTRPLTAPEVSALFRSEVPASFSVTAGRLVAEFASRHDGLGLRGLYDIQDGRRITSLTPSRNLWRLRLVPKAGPDGYFSGSMAIDWNAPELYPFSVFVTNTATGEAALPLPTYNGTYWLRWQNIPLPEATVFDAFDLPLPPTPGTPDYPGTVSVTVKLVPVSSESAIEARIYVDVHSSYWSLGEVGFPRLGGLGPPRGHSEQTQLVLPEHTIGRQLKSPFACINATGACLADNILDSAAVPRNYPGRDLTMPWFGLYDEVERKSGLYVGLEDPWAYLKALQFRRTLPLLAAPQEKTSPWDPALSAEVDIIAEQVGTPGGQYNGDNQPTRIAIQDGDWFDLARRYRTFAVTTPWATNSKRLAERTALPPWLKGAGWLQEGHYVDITRSHCALLASLGAVPKMALYHYVEWDSANDVLQPPGNTNNTPFVLPAPDFDFQKTYKDRSSTAFEAQLVTDCRAAASSPITPGGPAVVYLNPTVWDAGRETSLSPQSPEVPLIPWTSPAMPSSQDPAYPGILSPDHKAVVWGNGTPTLPSEDLAPADGKPDCRRMEPDYIMCPGSIHWRDTIRDEIVRIGSLPDEAGRPHRLAGIYLDMLSTWAPTPCYAQGHLHGGPGGSWYVGFWTDILANAKADLQSIPGHETAGFYSEGFAEPYIGALDGFFVQEDTVSDAVPLAMVVYHDYALFLGRSTPLGTEDVDKLPGAVAKQGQAFAWGVAPGGIIRLLQDHDLFGPVSRYMAPLAMMRQRLSAYLVYGEFRRPPTARWLEESADPTCNPATANVTASLVAGPPPQATSIPTASIPVSHLQVGAITWSRPSIEATAWRSSGSRGAIVLAGLDVAHRQTVFVKIDRSELGLPPGPLQVRLASLGSDACLGTVEDSGWVSVTLPSCAVAALEVIPGAGACP